MFLLIFILKMKNIFGILSFYFKKDKKEIQM